MAILSLPIDHQRRCQDVFKVVTKDMQLMVIKHIGQGEDCILIAGCGWGKSLVYFLPLALWEDRTIVVISPLLALMREQQEKLQLYGFNSICLDSSQRIDVGLLRRLNRGEFRAVFMTPESILSVGKSSGRGKTPIDSLWGMSGWRERLQAIVIDETHCVSSWGKNFRKAYARLGELRDIAPAHVAFVAMSATLPVPILREIKQSVRFCNSVPVYNVGNNRPNIRLEVRFLPHKNILQAFDFLVDKEDIQKTIIYFDSRNDVQNVRDYLRSLRSLVANDQRDIIRSFHSLYSDEYKYTTLKHFREGRIKILLSTEAAGMGCDINDVIHVIQFKEPSTVSCLVQRFGRAARDASLQGHAILLASHRKKAKSRTNEANRGNNNMTSTSTSKRDPDIKKFIETTTCRRQILNSVFGNLQIRNENCCDLCSPAPPPLVLQHYTPPTPRISAPTPTHVALAKRLIFSWSVVYRKYYMNRDLQMMETTLMDDNIVAKLAKKCKHVTGRESLRSIIKWRLHNKHDSLLAKLLIKLNKDQQASSLQMH